MSAVFSCPSVEDLHLLVDGQKALEEIAAFSTHLEQCAHCAKRLEKLSVFLAMLPEVRRAAQAQPGYSPEELEELRRRAMPPAALISGEATLTEYGSPRDTLSEGEAQAGAAVLSALAGYEIMQELGRGGMGVVYKARQVKADRIVALKMILVGAHASNTDLARFRTEAEASARLQHPNIVQIHEVGEHDGLPFFSLEYCPGGSLDKKLAGTPQTSREAASLVEILARAMQAAHDKGVIHRDLKPANVLLDEHGNPKITDFGLAKKLDDAGQTQSGAVMGTPSYMAPEQAGGETKKMGPLTDVYALGAILYELLTGRPPFKAATPLSTIMQVLNDEPVPPSQLQSATQRDLETICLMCLQKDPVKRYASAQALADDLRRYLKGEPIHARPVGNLERTVKWVRRHPAKALACLLPLIGIVSIVGIAVAVDQSLAARLLREEKARTAAALAEANTQRQRAENEQKSAEKFRFEAERLATALAMTQAQTQGEAGQIDRAFLGLAHGLVQTPAKAEDLQATTRKNLALWQQQLHRLQMILPEKGDLVNYSADGLRAVVLNNANVQVFDLPTGTPLGPTLKHPNPVTIAALSPDGKLLITTSNDKIVRRIDVASGKLLGLFAPGPVFINEIRFHPQGSWFMTVQDRKVMRCWDSATGKELGRFAADGNYEVMTLSPDGTMLARTQAKRASWWAVPSGKLVGTTPEQAEEITSLAFSPKSDLLATGAAGRIHFWKVATAEQSGQALSIPDRALSLAFDPTGRKLAVGIGTKDDTPRGQVRLFDLASYKLLEPAFAHRVGVNHVAFHPSRPLLLAITKDGAVRVCDTATHQQIGQPLVHPHTFTHAVFTAGDRLLAVTLGPSMYRQDKIGNRLSEGTRGYLWQLPPEQLGTVTLLHSAPVSTVAFSPNGNAILSASEDKTLRVWDVATGRAKLTPIVQPNGIYRAHFSPDGKRIIAETTVGTSLWDSTTGEHLPPTAVLGYSPDGRYHIVLDVQKRNPFSMMRPIMRSRLMEAATGKSIMEFPHNTFFRPHRVYFSPDSQFFLLTGGGDGGIVGAAPKAILVNIAAKQQSHYDGSVGIPSQSPFSPDSKCFVSRFDPRFFGSPGSNVALVESDSSWKIRWKQPCPGNVQFSPTGDFFLHSHQKRIEKRSVATGELMVPPMEHAANVVAVTCNDDGSLILSASVDQTARLWDAATGMPIGLPLRHDSFVHAVAFGPRGLLATGSSDGKVRVWEVPAKVDLDSAQLVLRAEILTGQALDRHGIIRQVSYEDWHQRRNQGIESGLIAGKTIEHANAKVVVFDPVKQPEPPKPLPPGRLVDFFAKTDHLTPKDPKDKLYPDHHHKAYLVKLRANRAYVIAMVSNQIDTYLRLEDADGKHLDHYPTERTPIPPSAARIIVTPTRDAAYRIIAASQSVGGEFTLTVFEAGATLELKNQPEPFFFFGTSKPIPKGNLKSVFEKADKLTLDDEKDRVRTMSHRKSYIIKLQAKRVYVIDMVSKEFDSFLRLEDAAGKQLDQNDDGGEGLNSRIVFTAPSDGDYRIIATSFGGPLFGQFTLTVREVDPTSESKAPQSVPER